MNLTFPTFFMIFALFLKTFILFIHSLLEVIRLRTLSGAKTGEMSGVGSVAMRMNSFKFFPFDQTQRLTRQTHRFMQEESQPFRIWIQAS